MGWGGRICNYMEILVLFATIWYVHQTLRNKQSTRAQRLTSLFIALLGVIFAVLMVKGAILI